LQQYFLFVVIIVVLFLRILYKQLAMIEIGTTTKKNSMIVWDLIRDQVITSIPKLIYLLLLC